VTRARFERATPSFGERSDSLIVLSFSCVHGAIEGKRERVGKVFGVVAESPIRRLVVAAIQEIWPAQRLTRSETAHMRAFSEFTKGSQDSNPRSIATTVAKSGS